ncbi:MAG: M14 family zinc carboxypeptidase [Bacteroidia bacterium]
MTKTILKTAFLFALIVLYNPVKAQKTPFELGNGNQSATYYECINFYKKLASETNRVSVLSYGETDSGEPLHLVVLAQGKAPANTKKDKQAFIQKIKNEKKSVLLVMNGIHPGEPEGIDASMMLARDLAYTKSNLLNNLVVCIIPVYNIGGALNRNCCTRANQNGPELYGFRGNAQNLDLNRDFVKGDSKNTWAFWQMYHDWRPDVFIDNHTSNGADYQYTMTLIASQKDKQNYGVKKYMEKMLPLIDSEMAKRDEPLSPYVNVHGKALDNEIVAFFESPRYSTGYTTLWGTVSFVAEAHMLKPFNDRVWATYKLMESILVVMQNTKDDLEKRDFYTVKHNLNKKYWPIAWQLDKSKYSEIEFKGYEYEYQPSAIPGQKRLYYNHKKPFERKIRYYDSYNIADSIDKPFAYVIPRGWYKVVDRLKENGCLVKQAFSDTIITVEAYRITNFESAKSPYEGHFPHKNIKTEITIKKLRVNKGDYFVVLPNRFAIETLEPRATDAFLVWNFFDPILQQKEWFSAYVFDDVAKDILETDKVIKAKFDDKRAKEPDFAKNYGAQLYWIYQQSPYYEKAHMQYPVYRIMDVCKLPIK